MVSYYERNVALYEDTYGSVINAWCSNYVSTEPTFSAGLLLVHGDKETAPCETSTILIKHCAREVARETQHTLIIYSRSHERENVAPFVCLREALGIKDEGSTGLLMRVYLNNVPLRLSDRAHL